MMQHDLHVAAAGGSSSEEPGICKLQYGDQDHGVEVILRRNSNVAIHRIRDSFTHADCDSFFRLE